MNSGYDNAAYHSNDDGINRNCWTTTMEMEKVVVADTVMPKCCVGSNSTNQNLSDNKIIPKTSDVDVNTNVCMPKCPSIKASPWDPVKTRFAAVLTMAMVIWLLYGIFIIKY